MEFENISLKEGIKLSKDKKHYILMDVREEERYKEGHLENAISCPYGILKECYEQMGADYEGVLGRLRSEGLIKKFAKKFLDDGSFQSLKDNLAQGNGEEAFRAAHTLKGVCQNLGFDNLYQVSFDITEKLRGRETDGCEELFAKVEEQYKKTTDAIHMMED